MQDYKDAMKNADTVRKNTVNMVRAAIKQHEVDQRVTLEDDADIVKIIKKQVKMRADALEDFVKAGRDDMLEGYKKEIEILQSYLPEEMGEEEIRTKSLVRVLSDNLDADVLDLSGCSLSDVLYYPSSGTPVMAMTGEGNAVIIMGYDAKNTILYDPREDRVYKLGMNDSALMFERAGNRFITYIPN